MKAGSLGAMLIQKKSKQLGDKSVGIEMVDKRLQRPLEMASQADIVRFLKKVKYQDPPPGLEQPCMIWIGATSRGGKRPGRIDDNGWNWYGTFKYAGTGIRAHRFACEAIGKRPPLAEGYHRDHLCNISLCVQTAHIEYVTHEENERRRNERRLSTQEVFGPKEPDPLSLDD